MTNKDDEEISARKRKPYGTWEFKEANIGPPPPGIEPLGWDDPEYDYWPDRAYYDEELDTWFASLYHWRALSWMIEGEKESPGYLEGMKKRREARLRQEELERKERRLKAGREENLQTLLAILFGVVFFLILVAITWMMGGVFGGFW